MPKKLPADPDDPFFKAYEEGKKKKIREALEEMQRKKDAGIDIVQERIDELKKVHAEREAKAKIEAEARQAVEGRSPSIINPEKKPKDPEIGSGGEGTRI